MVVERPQDAARVFLHHLREAVDRHVLDHSLPPPVYAVSVPAAFEANQRRDLMRALAGAGILVEDAGLIDEPNAAFLSYVFDMERGAEGPSVSALLARKAGRVLVFDFGAGTCDISVLEVSIADGRLSSRNLAISKFLALGGDDIDRAIARRILLPQLRSDGDPDEVLSSNERDKLLLPRLKHAAEELKIRCSKQADARGAGDPSDLRECADPIVADGIDVIEVRGRSWTLDEPQITLGEFAEIMEPFLAAPASPGEDRPDRTPSVLKPVSSALEKAGLTPDDLDMVLFIGGSSANSLVRGAIERHMGRFVECVTPCDLRAHVSQGTAIHSLHLHGLGHDIVRPITSEPIYVLTQDDNREGVFDAGPEVPSSATITQETVIDVNQPTIEVAPTPTIMHDRETRCPTAPPNRRRPAPRKLTQSDADKAGPQSRRVGGRLPQSGGWSRTRHTAVLRQYCKRWHDTIHDSAGDPRAGDRRTQRGRTGVPAKVSWTACGASPRQATPTTTKAGGTSSATWSGTRAVPWYCARRGSTTAACTSGTTQTARPTPCTKATTSSR